MYKEKPEKKVSAGTTPEFFRSLADVQADLFVHAMAVSSGDEDAAWEILQETNLALCRDFARYNPVLSSFYTWACRVLDNKAKQIKTRLALRNKRFLRLEDLGISLEELQRAAPPQDGNDRAAALAECLRKLPKPDRRMISLRYFEHKSVAELAKKFKLGQSAVKMRLLRIRQSLAYCIQDALCRLENGEAELPDEPSAFELFVSDLFDGDGKLSPIPQTEIDGTQLLMQFRAHAVLLFAAETRRRNRSFKAKRRKALLGICVPLGVVAGTLALFFGRHSTLYTKENGIHTAALQSAANYEETPMEMKQLMLASLAIGTGTFAHSTAMFTDGLQADFRAEKAKTTDSAMKLVGEWDAEGAANVSVHAEKGARPYYLAEGFLRADGSSTPAVRFNKTKAGADVTNSPHYMSTAEGEETTFGITKDGTWFFVANETKNTTGKCLFGLAESSSRFGVFGPGTTGTDPDWSHRLHLANNLMADATFATEGGLVLLDMRREGDACEGAWQGTHMFSGTQNKELSTPSTFYFGALAAMTTSGQHPYMDVGELVIYNRALNDAEMRIVRNSLAAKFGLSLTSGAIYEGASLGFPDGVVGVGRENTAEVCASGSSGGLSISVSSGALSAGEYIFFGNNGQNGLQWDSELKAFVPNCRWRLERHAFACSELAVSVSLSEMGITGAHDLRASVLFRASSSEDFAALDVAPSWDASSQLLSFVLTGSQIATGEFALALDRASQPAGAKPTAWFKASEGVEFDEAGAVTKWTNLGTCSEEISVIPAQGSIVASENDTFAAMSFDGASYLVSPSGYPSNLGCTDGTSSFYAIHRPSSAQVNGQNYGLFGFQSNNSPRLGMRAQNKKLYTHHFRNVASEVSNTLGEWQLHSSRMYENTVESSCNIFETANATAEQQTPNYRLFTIGALQAPVDWWPPYLGDIAEIRIYNRALDDAENRLLQLELYTQYLTQDGYTQDFAGIASGTSLVASSIPVSANSGGLSVEFADASPVAARSLSIAHDGTVFAWLADENRLARVWKAQCENVSAQRVLFVFDTSALSGLSGDWLLLYRSDADGEFETVASAVNTGADFVVLEASGVADGFYTLSNGTSPSGAAISAGLKGWYRADSATPTLWSNKTGDNSCDAVFSGSGVSVGENSVTFDGNGWYATAEDVDFGFSGEMTWFAVAALSDTRLNRGVFGMMDKSFGLWFAGNSGEYTRWQICQGQNHVQVANIASGEHLFDGRFADRVSSAYLDGSLAGTMTANQIYNAGSFNLGRSVLAQGLIGSISEVRVYNRALNDAERIIVQNHLAARYNLALDGNAVYSASDCKWDLTGIGQSNGGAVGTSEGSGGLYLTALSGLADETFLLASHDNLSARWKSGAGMKQLGRTWRLSAKNADALAVRLVFDLSKTDAEMRTEEERPVYHLLLKDADSETWTASSATAAVSGNTVAFELPAGALSDGTFVTLGANIVSSGTVIILLGN